MYKNLILISCFISIFIGLLSCNSKNIANEISEEKYYDFGKELFITTIEKNIPNDLILKIIPGTNPFSKEDYIYFSKEDYISKNRYPGMSSRQEKYDIYIDKRLLNYFSLIFTPKGSIKISLYINQKDSINVDYSKRYYYIHQERFNDYLKDKVYDVYGFHNDSLVFKGEYMSNAILFDHKYDYLKNE